MINAKMLLDADEVKNEVLQELECYRREEFLPCAIVFKNSEGYLHLATMPPTQAEVIGLLTALLKSIEDDIPDPGPTGH